MEIFYCRHRNHRSRPMNRILIGNGFTQIAWINWMSIEQYWRFLPDDTCPIYYNSVIYCVPPLIIAEKLFFSEMLFRTLVAILVVHLVCARFGTWFVGFFSILLKCYVSHWLLEREIIKNVILKSALFGTMQIEKSEFNKWMLSWLS